MITNYSITILTLLLTTLQSLLPLSSSTTPSLDEPFQSTFNYLDHIPCVSLYTRTGRIGCGTQSRDVQSGRLIHWSGSSPDESYVAVITGVEFTDESVQSILDLDTHGLLRGVLVVNSTDDGGSNDYPSPAAVYPRGTNTPESSLTPNPHAWNPNGDSLLYRDTYPTPIVWIPDPDTSSYILAEARRQLSHASPAIAAQLNYYMGPEGETSASCLAWIDQDDVWRPKCLPLGGNSVWATVGGGGERDVVFLATGVDATSLFHDASGGANAAAGSVVALILAARILGGLELDGLGKDVGVAFFQGENFGYLGSRLFFNDVANFECEFAVERRNVTGCTYPLRPSLDFMGLSIDSLVAVDQISVLQNENTAYVHSTDDFILNVMLQLTEDGLATAQSSAEGDDGNVPLPPSPLTSLLSFNENVAGAVLTGYDDTFIEGMGYASHFDRISHLPIDLNAIVSAAILLSRTAVALAYDDGDEDYESAANYATNLIADDVITSTDEFVQTLAHCLFEDGNCELIANYSGVERKNMHDETGVDMGAPSELGQPPSYYVSILDTWNGLPFVQVNGRTYGAYNGTDFDETRGDSFLSRPSALEMTLFGLMNDALGQINDGDDAISCESTSDCDGISSCRAVCTGGGRCVCSRANYHVALDEAFEPALNYTPSYYKVKEDDGGITPMYTEPYWSSDVGVKVYRVASDSVGYWALGWGLIFATISVAAVLKGKKKLKTEKLY